MITTTVGQLLEAETALRQLSSAPLSVKVAYRLAKLLEKAQQELKTFYQQRERLMRELGTVQTEDGKAPTITVRAENVQQYIDACQQLIEERVELSGEPFDLTQLNGHDLTAADVLALGVLVTYTDS